MNARMVLVAAVAGASLSALSGLSGCSDPAPPAPSAPPSVSATRPPYDPAKPARAALVLAPAATTELRVVDWDVVRRDVGLPELTSSSSAAEQAAFRARAATGSAVLDPPLLEGADARLRASFGFGADDVAWEAHWSGPGVSGWALTFGPQVDMAAVARAVHAGVGPLRGAGVRRGLRLVTKGLQTDGPTMGYDPHWAALVPGPGESFLVRRGCVTDPQVDAAVAPLAGFALTFGDHVATVRMGTDRGDLFTRARLGDAAFRRAFRHPVADPSSGRIGYDVRRPADAASVARAGDLPFGVCAAGD